MDNTTETTGTLFCPYCTPRCPSCGKPWGTGPWHPQPWPWYPQPYTITWTSTGGA